MNEIRTTITYNLPILRKYMIFVRIYNLFGFPVKYELSYFAREAHHTGLHYGIFGKKRLEVLNKSVLRIDAVEPVGNATEAGIQFV